MDRTQEAGGVDIVRRAIADPTAQAYLSADRLRREVRRLEARLSRVRTLGGPYGEVDFSDNVRDLLGRLEAGATLSQAVH
ncbi:MAG: hypothetical protein FJ288_16625 [Planctomycetes bacterium]|nr:hypothetical protein [Planctomycetota bacterium]